MKLYKHYKNGKLYEIVDRCMIQENNEWVEAVIYKSYNGHRLFVRSSTEFFKKFKLEE